MGKENSTESDRLSIEELKGINKTKDKVFEGMKAAQGWRNGRMVTPLEYDKAQADFLGSAMSGRKVNNVTKRR